jgi:hypothetical protein
MDYLTQLRELSEADQAQAFVRYKVQLDAQETLYALLMKEGSEIAESELTEVARHASAHLSIDYSNAHLLLRGPDGCAVIFLNRLCHRDAVLSVDVVTRYSEAETAQAIAHYREAVFCTDLESWTQ